jgi:hypothetical protein
LYIADHDISEDDDAAAAAADDDDDDEDDDDDVMNDLCLLARESPTSFQALL